VSRGNFKQDLFGQFARVAKALAHGNRLELLELLAQGERSVEELARVSGLSMANASQHLQQLRHAGLVTTRKEGVRVIYALHGEDVLRLTDVLRGVAERHLAEVERLVATYLLARDSMEPVAAAELMDRVRIGSALILDVRPPEEYAAGHLPGAVCIPLKELERRMAEIPEDKEIIAYCRGPYCVLAFDAVAALRATGRNARRLEYGFPEWKQANMPVEH
jgi:rhodanese-related sulfurtransferase/DNA-binding transcriptional ArsR family regulator